MTTTAEAAGLSRVTLRRIERVEPAVTIGAYLNVITALGWHLTMAEPAAPQASEYERNWRHTDHSATGTREHDFIQHLVDTWGHGRLLV